MGGNQGCSWCCRLRLVIGKYFISKRVVKHTGVGCPERRENRCPWGCSRNVDVAPRVVVSGHSRVGWDWGSWRSLPTLIIPCFYDSDSDASGLEKPNLL